jgi:hypothetical protein
MQRLFIPFAVLLALGCARRAPAARPTEAEVTVHVPCVREPCTRGGEAPDAQEPPPRPGGRPPIAMLALGQAHSCALTEDGAVHCWGDNSRGQLGDIGHRASPVPAPVPSIPPMAAVWAGWDATCARTRDGGELWCWGRTGLPNREPGFATALPFRDVRLVGLGDRRGCFVTGDGQLWCWGDYGRPHGPDWDAPRRVPIDGTSAIHLIWNRGCVIAGDGRLRCWGQPDNLMEIDRIGDELWTYSGLEDVAMVAFAEQPHSLPVVVDTAGRIFATERGERSRRTHYIQLARRELPNLDDVVSLHGAGAHFCVRRSAGTVACWGSNFAGEVGDGSNAERRLEPRTLPLTGVEEVATGSHHTCARTATTLYCWGSNARGQLGIEGPRELREPTEVPW